MNGKQRREALSEQIRTARAAVTAAELAEKFGVSRQVIVQDIALLRAAGSPVVSTNRGYLWAVERRTERVFKVLHTDEETEDELNLIVDAGGRVEDVFVNHRIYGTLSAPLGIENRVQVKEYMRSITGGKSKPLKSVTEGYHYHTVSAPSEAVLDEIGEGLRARGYLIEK